MFGLRRRTLKPRCGSALRRVAALLLLCFVAGCTETDEQLVEEIGVTRLLLIDTGLLPQSINNLTIRLQAIEWVLTEARLDIDGALIDLLAGDRECRTVDTVEIDPYSPDLCAEGVVIESSEGQDPFELKLFLTFETVAGYRAITPNYLDENDPTYRDDGDQKPTAGIPGSIFENTCVESNGTDCRDNCPVIPNDQTLPAVGQGFSFGAACALGSLRDSDADGDADGFDNCVYIPNSNQLDTMGLAAEGLRDGIGDACESISGGLGEQRISLTLTGGNELSFENFQLDQTENFPSFIVVDFNSQSTLANCDLESGNCAINSGEIQVCTTSSPAVALEGCFDR